jgi:hypothetical protein
MNQVQEIIADYTAADEEMRLSMFLTHRKLRPQFTEIDMTGLKKLTNAASKRALKFKVGLRLYGLARNCWGWLRQCRTLS